MSAIPIPIDMTSPGTLQPPSLVQIPIPGPLPPVDWVDPATYQSALLDEISAALLTELQTLGMAVPQAVQTQDTGLAQSRQTNEFIKAGNNVGIVYDAMGWKLPAATRPALAQENLNNLGYAAQDSIDRLVIEAFNLTQKNYWKSRELALQSENARMDFIFESVKVAVALLQAKVAMVETIVAKDLGLAEIIDTWNQDQIALVKADAEVLGGMAKVQAHAQGANIEQQEAGVALQVGTSIIAEKTAVADRGITQEIANATATINAQISAATISANTTHVAESYHHNKSTTTEQSSSTDTRCEVIAENVNLFITEA